MSGIRLEKLPDRTPVKLTILLSPQLNADLRRYSVAYEAAYGTREAIADLIPFMLASFLESDPAFRRARKDGKNLR